MAKRGYLAGSLTKFHQGHGDSSQQLIYLFLLLLFAVRIQKHFCFVF